MKTIITFFLLVFLSFSLMAAESLTFKFSNPRIENYAPDNYLVFDVLVKATTNGTYLFGSQVICNITLANFNTAVQPSAEKGAFISGSYDPPGPPAVAYEKYSVSANYNSGNLNISVLANANLNAYKIPGHSEITTAWQTLCTLYCLVSNNAGMAGISFQPPAMNGYQKYATGVAPLYSDYYANPNLYEGFDFTEMYLNRIFCGQYGWTQAGGVVDWTASVNTSVWDTTTVAATVGDDTHPDALANGLRIHPLGRLAINPNTTLTVAGTLNNAAGNTGLIIRSNSSGTGSLKHNTDNVPATIQRYITGSTDLGIYKYHFVSIPLMQSENPTSNLFFGSYLFEFIESTSVWNPLGSPTGTNLFSNKGYMTYFPGDNKTYTFSGKLNNGAFPIPITKNGAGYNLVPNPYPSAIDWDAPSGWTKAGKVESAIYIWPAGIQPNGNLNYATYVGPGSFTNGGSRYIAQGQSFFVHATTTPAGFAMNNDVRVHNPVAFFKEEEIIRNVLRIKTVANDASDEMVVRFVGVATPGFDGDWDAYKLVGGVNAPQLNSVASDDSKLCINALPFNENETVVPMNFSFSSATNVTFTASGMETFTVNSPIYLEDISTGAMINLRDNPVYAFSYESGSDENRFKLHFAKVVGIGEEHEPTEGTVYISGGELYIDVPSMKGQKTEIKVYNMLGQQLDLNRVTMNGMTTMPFSLPAGVYIVRVTSATQVFASKLVNN